MTEPLPARDQNRDPLVLRESENRDPLVPVMDRFARGYPKHPDLVDPNDQAYYAPLSEALTTRLDWDAHFAAYSLPSIPRRLAASGALELGPTMVLFVLDVEPPGHAEVTDQWWSLERDRLAQVLADHPGGYVYRTRGGYRLLWQLSEPWTLRTRQDAASWSASYEAWRAHVQAKYLITGDDTCGDWTRLYRLPLVTREGQAQDPGETYGDPRAIGTWGLPRVEALAPAHDAQIPTFEVPQDPNIPDVDRLYTAAQALAKAWPDTGRHQAQLALAGALARMGWPSELIADFTTTVAELHTPGSGLPDKRRKAAEDSVSKVLGGDSVSGWPTLKGLLRSSPGCPPGVLDGEDLVQVACSNLGVPGTEPADPNFFEALYKASNPPPPPPAPGSFAEILNRAALDVVAVIGDGKTNTAPMLEPLFEPVNILLQREFPSTPWLVRNLAIQGGLGVISTEPKSAKTWFATEIAMAVATGTKVAGTFETLPDLTVAYFYAEDMARSVQSMIRALAKGRGVDPEVAAQRMHAQPAGRVLDLTKTSDVALLIASCRRIGHVDLLVLDPLRNIHSAEEDKADAMAPVMRNLHVVKNLLGCTLLFNHHSAKTSESNARRRPGQKMRGSSVIHGAVDFGAYLGNLRGNGVNEFINTVDSEVKGARGAGKFDLHLDIEDGPNGTADCAIFKTKAIESKSPTEQLEELVWTIVRTMYSPTFKTPASIQDIRKRTTGRSETIAAALQRGADMGLFTQKKRGLQFLGWELTEEGKRYGREGCASEVEEPTPIDHTSVAAAFVARTN